MVNGSKSTVPIPKSDGASGTHHKFEVKPLLVNITNT